VSIEDFVNNPPAIETARLLLRKPSLDDAANVFAYASDPGYFRFIPAEPHASIEDSGKFLQGVLDAMARGERIAWGIVDKASGKFVGSCNFHDIAPKHNRAALGYAIARTHWGHGYMTECIRSVIAWGVSVAGLHRIEAICDVDNVGSERVMQKCGMRLEGTLRDYRLEQGVYRSFRQYAILAGEVEQ
jgi:ribosomal-protein-alanine N-acetyltransferase